MPPKRAAHFPVACLQAGKRKWIAGRSGPMVKNGRSPVLGLDARPLQRREVRLLGEVLFGRDRLAFEVQELDFNPASVQRLVQLKKQRHREVCGGWDSESDGESDDSFCDFNHVCKATKLAAKHSIQVKFQDIERIDITCDRLQILLSKAPQCYVKPAGEHRIVNMEVGRDITKGAKTITLTTTTFSENFRPRRLESVRMLSLGDVREELAQHSPRLAALLQDLPTPAPDPASTPRGKKRQPSEEELAGSSTKQPRSRGAAPCVAPQPIIAVEGSWLKKAAEQFGLTGPVDTSLSDDWWKMYVQERQALEEKSKEESGSGEEKFDPYQAEQTECDQHAHEV